MDRLTFPFRHRHLPLRRRSGFSFVEILFAVMILGIGFVMLAAIFPVAIQQAQTSSDETVSAAIAWNALTTIQEKLSDADLPPVGPAGTRFQETFYPGVMRSFRDPQAAGVPTLKDGQDTERNVVPGTSVRKGPTITLGQPSDYLWYRVKGESVVVDDRRFAWVAFYRRHIMSHSPDEPTPYAQVILVVARAREDSQYTRKDFDGAIANLQPRPVRFNLTRDGEGRVVDQVVRFIGGETGAVAEGAHLIVAHDNLPSNVPGGDVQPQGYMNAHVFRIGNSLGGNTWELSPETEFTATAVAGTPVRGLTNATGYVIGRTGTRTGNGNDYAGAAQDVAVYTMMIAPR